MKWCGFKGDEIEELCFKTEQLIMLKGAQKHGDKGKASEIKDIRNLAVKMKCLEKFNFSIFLKK